LIDTTALDAALAKVDARAIPITIFHIHEPLE
jgi:hypothetical protein